MCKNIINNLTKDWSGGSYLRLNKNSKVSGYRPLISIGYKYNACRVLYFITTADAGSTNSDIPYLSMYPEPFSNFSIFPVAHPLSMSKLFVSVNEVEPNNKSIQSDL